MKEQQRWLLDALQATLASYGIVNPQLPPMPNLDNIQNGNLPAASANPSEQQSGVQTQQHVILLQIPSQAIHE
ncbi:hypothetical protein COLO4_38038 [Corchorus olitorius]|uniref:Uncharacterized protein n=1 Tax=Corchorus olitorius TaxID=93759 RepID=A0A1R3FXF2_9ROSI|nr:hypothetical protein COLO4_38038 [Corchorus olitorius]